MGRRESSFPSTTLTPTCFTLLERCVSESSMKRPCIRTRDDIMPPYCSLQGDGNIRYYEISSEKPYIHYLTEYRSNLPQKGMGETHTHTHTVSPV